MEHELRLNRVRAELGPERCIEEAPERELIWRFAPGRCGASSRGYLDVEHTSSKPAGVFRVVVIGDSVAEGALVGPDESFARVMEQRLNGQRPGRYEVVKLARRGYGTRQELFLLEHEALQYAPDLIVWSYVLNDAVDVRLTRGFNSMAELHRPRSYLWQRVEMAALRRRHARLRELHGHADWRVIWHHDRWDEVVRSVEQMQRLSRRERVPLVFAIHPVLEQGKSFESYGFADLHRRLAELAKQQGLEVTDLLEAYRGKRPEELTASRSPWDDTHPNALGHSLAADVLVRAVRAHDP